jgi:hypothetical protein
MHRPVVIVLLVLAFVVGAAGSDIPPARRVILHSGKWTPSQAEADAAFRCAQHFLAEPTVKEKYQLSQITLIREHARQYRVQFVGHYRKRRKVILCNFFPVQFPEEKQDGFYYWRQQLVEVMDGGFWFWRIEYNPQSDSCSEFSSNGYA